MQARAEATRQRILDSAVDLFSELGYGETGLADVLQRARVSKGAFYYHFTSKESLAAAIIEDFRGRVSVMLQTETDASASPLEQFVAASFASAAMIRYDKTARIGNELLQALSQISTTATQTYAEWTERFVKGFSRAVAGMDLPAHRDVTELAQGVWAGVLGSHLLSGALGDDPFERLANTWRAMLYPISPADLDQMLDRIQRRYQAVAAS
ncbi:MAG: TetR family transcriptional regulator [Mycobacterium sp.]